MSESNFAEIQILKGEDQDLIKFFFGDSRKITRLNKLTRDLTDYEENIKNAGNKKIVQQPYFKKFIDDSDILIYESPGFGGFWNRSIGSITLLNCLD